MQLKKVGGTATASNKKQTPSTVTSDNKKTPRPVFFSRQVQSRFKRTIIDRVARPDGSMTDEPNEIQSEHVIYWETIFSKDGKGTEPPPQESQLNALLGHILEVVPGPKASLTEPFALRNL